MDGVIRFLNILLPILYVSCLFLYGYCFFQPAERIRKGCRTGLRVTLVFQLIYLALVGLRFGRLPVANLFEAMGFMAFAIAAVYAYLERRVGEESTGLFILVFVFLLQMVSSAFVTHSASVPAILRGWRVAFHIVCAMASYAALAISAIFSVMYLMLYHDIKKHRFGLIYSRLPSLDVLGTLCFQGAWVGFVFLTLAIFAGAIWSYSSSSALPGVWYEDPKVIIVVLIWLIYGTLVGLKTRHHWQGPRVAYFSLIGFSVALFSLVFVNLFLTGFHSFR